MSRQSEVRKPVVFFDLGGTLVDLRGMLDRVGALIRARFPEAESKAEDLALRWAIQTADALPQAQGTRFLPERKIAARVLRDVLSSTAISLSEDDAFRVILKAWSSFAKEAVLSPDITESWWESIHAHADGIGLVTDIDEEAAAELLDRLDLRHHFDSVVLSETERAYKPNPVLYQRALGALRARPEASLFVSDSPLDLQGADAGGMATALIQRSPRTSSLSPPPKALAMQSMDELPEILAEYSRSGRFRA